MSQEWRNHPLYRKNKAIAKARDEVCWLCGIYVDKTLHWTSWLSAAADHIVPPMHGGHPWDLDNLALAHRICNSVKHDKTLDQITVPVKQQMKNTVIQLKSELKTSGRNWLAEIEELSPEGDEDDGA